MEESMTMDIVKCCGYLLYYVPDLFMTERIIVEFSHLHHSVQVHVKEFEKHIEMILMTQNLNASYDIRMFKANHSFYFCVAHRLLP